VRPGHGDVQQPPSSRLPRRLYEGVEFGFEGGGGVGGDVAWFSTHAGVGFENLAASASGRRLVAAAWCYPVAAVRRCPAAI
jgi:hypothetical protein